MPTASSSSPTTRPASAPSEGWEQKSMAGVHVYSLLCERMFGRRPARVQLLYLSKPEKIITAPTDQSLRGVEVKSNAVMRAMRAGVHARTTSGPARRRCARSARSGSSAPSSAATRARPRPRCSRGRPNVKAGRSCPLVDRVSARGARRARFDTRGGPRPSTPIRGRQRSTESSTRCRARPTTASCGTTAGVAP